MNGPMVMHGYHNLPEETAAVLVADGYVKTLLSYERYVVRQSPRSPTEKVRKRVLRESGER